MPSKPADLKAIADGTIETVRRAVIEDRLNRQTFPLAPYLRAMMKGTMYYTPDNRHLVNWRRPPPLYPNRSAKYVRTEMQLMTTLHGCWYMQDNRNSTVGVLNFASATRPGGGFRNGASAQEETLARSSTLFISLESQTAKPFYDLHNSNGKDPFYSHAMLYSPQVVLFRDDRGGWPSPTRADVLTCAAVNAKQVRTWPSYQDAPDIEKNIEDTMRERMGRILELFEHRGARNLVLGSFGTGVFQNNVGTVAKIWKELLYDPNARFRFSFHRVLFAIPDRQTHEEFGRVFSDSA